MKSITFASLIAVPVMAFAWAIPAWADDVPATTCKDGTTTTSTGKGTCSGHGGVQKATAATPAASTPATVPVQAPPGGSGAVTTCKDGTTSTSTGKGTCSGHGGQVKSTAPKSAAAATPTPAAESPATVPVQTPAPATGSSTTAAKTSTATKSAPTTTASNTDPTGATAKCKDGTYSKSQHRSGTCSSHGGVAEWLTAK